MCCMRHPVRIYVHYTYVRHTLHVSMYGNNVCIHILVRERGGEENREKDSEKERKKE